MGKLPDVVAAYTSNQSPTYLCSDATRILYNTTTKEVKYMWNFRGLNGTRQKSVRMDMQFGNSLDQPWYYMDGDTCHNYTGYFSYSDYSSCMVTIGSYPPDTVCALWMKRGMATRIPQACLDAFHETCGDGYADFDPKICNGTSSTVK
ncbi:uncharacterized protein LOC144157743 [Haemaphysalis longicornis]